MVQGFDRKICVPLDIVNNSIGKREKLIFLFSNHGFNDNIKAFYDYIVNEPALKEYRIVCSVNNYRKYHKYARHNVKFVSIGLGMLYYIIAKYCFYCYDIYPIKPANEQIVVNLGHGMPLKRIGNMIADREEEDINYFTYVLSTSENFKDIIRQSYRCEDRQVLVCGQPRTDEFFYDERAYTSTQYKKDINDKRMINELVGGVAYRKLFVWMPTARDADDFGRLPLVTGIGMKQLDDMLVEQNSIMIIKLHPMSDIEYETYSDYSNILVYTHEMLEETELSVFTLLKYSDALLTDYSSVAFDYLLMNKPIGYIIDDIKKYEHSRGFCIEEYEEYMPGKKITKEEDLNKFIKDCIMDTDVYGYDRDEINSIVNCYRDGHNSERLCEMIGLLKKFY